MAIKCGLTINTAISDWSNEDSIRVPVMPEAYILSPGCIDFRCA